MNIDFTDPTIWFAVSFIIFVLVVLKFAAKPIGQSLDSYAEKIKAELDEAAKLNEEAHAFLEQAKTRYAQANAEADRIERQANEQVILMRNQAEAELTATIALREKQAAERIAMLEEQAATSLRHAGVDTILAATEHVLAEQLNTERNSVLISEQTKHLLVPLKKSA
jgi:F-type H+-transporting ATPase subunit b